MIETVLTGGGLAGLIIAVGYAGKQAVDFYREHNASAGSPSQEVTDAVATNAMLVTALKEERTEVQRLSDRVNDLEQQNIGLYDKMRIQREHYEAELQELRGQLKHVSDRLQEMQERLRNEMPPPEMS